MAQIQNLEKVVAKLRELAAKARKEGKASVAVGYTARYALFVHENLRQKLKGQPRPYGLGVYWGPNGQPKFLEGPARQLRRVLADIIAQALRQGKTMSQALVLAGLRLQRESQERVPVELGNLRASAFTRLES
jgi:hypothetical protein